jgi:hypothetical protein
MLRAPTAQQGMLGLRLDASALTFVCPEIQIAIALIWLYQVRKQKPPIIISHKATGTRGSHVLQCDAIG